jgi:hypothetical protein
LGGVAVEGAVRDDVELLIDPDLGFDPLCFLPLVVVVEVSAAAPVLAEGVPGSVAVVFGWDPLDWGMEPGGMVPGVGAVPGIVEPGMVEPGLVAPGVIVPGADAPGWAGAIAPPAAEPVPPPAVCARAGADIAMAKVVAKIKALRIMISLCVRGPTRHKRFRRQRIPMFQYRCPGDRGVGRRRPWERKQRPLRNAEPIVGPEVRFSGTRMA